MSVDQSADLDNLLEGLDEPDTSSPEEAPVAPPVAAEDDGAAKPDEPRDEIDRLDPQPVKMELLSGTKFDLTPLKLRQFLRLLKIVTRGAADVLDQASLDFDDPEGFLQTFLGMVLFSIPEAENETVDFIQSMVIPADLTGDPKKDIIKVNELKEELFNPELEDTITIVQAIIERESEDLRALGKRLGSMLKMAEKIGATKSDSPTKD
jgi:hypothetical protein